MTLREKYSVQYTKKVKAYFKNLNSFDDKVNDLATSCADVLEDALDKIISKDLATPVDIEPKSVFKVFFSIDRPQQNPIAICVRIKFIPEDIYYEKELTSSTTNFIPTGFIEKKLVPALKAKLKSREIFMGDNEVSENTTPYFCAITIT